MSTTPSRYWFVKAWGTYQGLTWMEIQRRVGEALEECAPRNAIYKASDGGWRTTDDITGHNTRNVIQQFMLKWKEVESISTAKEKGVVK